MEADGCTKQQARDNIWMMDIDGLLVKDRPVGNLDGHKVWYAKDHKVMKTLLEVVKEIKPSVLIGKCLLQENKYIDVKLKSSCRGFGSSRSIHSRSSTRDGKE